MPKRRDSSSYIVSPQKHDTHARQEFVSVVLLGENYGYRMKSYGPIPLIRLGKITLLEKQVNVIKSVFPNYEILLCCGFGANKLITFVKEHLSHLNIRIIENQLHNNSNCCESIRLCLNNTMNTRFVICNGELVFTRDQLEQIDLNTSSMMIQEIDEHKNLDIGVIHNENYVENMSLGIKSSHWCEIMSLAGRPIVNSLRSIVAVPEYKNKFVFEAVNDLVRKYPIEIVDCSKYPMEKINNITTLKRLKQK